MKLKTKKLVFVGLIIVTIGATVGGIFIPPLFAIAGTALLGTIAVGKVIVAGHNQEAQEHASPEANPITPPAVSPTPPRLTPTTPPQHNLSPPLAGWAEAKEGLEAPELQRDFSMHISYKTNQHSPGGTVSPDAINVSVHTRSPGSNQGTPVTTPVVTGRQLASPSEKKDTPTRRGRGGRGAIPSPLKLSRKLTLPEDY